MLLHEIRTEFQSRIEDPTYWNDARSNTLANQALNDIIRRFDIKVSTYAEMSTVADQERYALPQDWISTELMYYDSSYDLVINILEGPREVYGKRRVPGNTGQPTEVFIWGRYDDPVLWFEPIPDAVYTIQHWYYRRPTKLVNDNDEPMISRDQHQNLIDFMEMRAKVQDEEMSESEFTAIWALKVREMRESLSKKNLHGRRAKPGSGKKQFPSANQISVKMKLSDPTGTTIW